MKLEKLLTLSQFVDEYCTQWANVRNYNNFLKQPITKEMFINPYSRPFNLMSKTYSKDRELFEEAEKKVIFDGWNKSTYYKYEIINGVVSIDFSNADFIKIIRNSHTKVLETTHDLAEATNGELTIKNLNI